MTVLEREKKGIGKKEHFQVMASIYTITQQIQAC